MGKASYTGYWADLSQLVTSYSREVLRAKRRNTTVKTLSHDLRTLRQAIERIGERCVTLWGKN
jgi:hypothetical protein